MRKTILICCILLLPTVAYPQMTAKYKGIQIDESIKTDFDSLLKKLPGKLKMHKDQCGRYNQPNNYTVAELISQEQEGIAFYCLMTDSSVIKNYSDPAYLYRINDLINMVLMARKPGTLIGYVDQIVFYFLNTQGDEFVFCAAGNWLFLNLSTLNKPFLYVPFQWQYGKILINTNLGTGNFSDYNLQKLDSYFSYPFQSKQTLKKAAVLYVDTNKRSKPIATLRPGEEIELLSWYQEWYKVKYFEKIGWIWGAELK